jgi:hypothetical protein
MANESKAPEGGILSAIEDFYSKFGYRSIDKVQWVS